MKNSVKKIGGMKNECTKIHTEIFRSNTESTRFGSAKSKFTNIRRALNFSFTRARR